MWQWKAQIPILQDSGWLKYISHEPMPLKCTFDLEALPPQPRWNRPGCDDPEKCTLHVFRNTCIALRVPWSWVCSLWNRLLRWALTLGKPCWLLPLQMQRKTSEIVAQHLRAEGSLRLLPWGVNQSFWMWNPVPISCLGTYLPGGSE